jgi:hypothetical protein
MKRLFSIVAVGVLIFTTANLVLAQSDPRVGTWKLNAAKSKSDAAPRKSETRTYQASGDSITMHAEVMNNDGSKQVYGYTAKLDGKDYPYTGQAPGGAETIAIKRVGKGTTAEQKKGGKLLFTSNNMVSDDGKIMTITTKGTDASGKSMNSMRVYDKQ